MAYQYGTCKNCWEMISQFVSTVVTTEPNWTHMDGSVYCPSTVAEPAE